MPKALHYRDHSRLTDSPVVIATGTERVCRQAAARALRRTSLKGLQQSQTADGTCYYGSGSDDHQGESVVIVY